MTEMTKIPQPEIEAYHAGYQAGYENGKRDAVRHGEWDYNDIIDSFECSVCGEGIVRNVFNFCPWCGAKMNAKEDE